MYPQKRYVEVLTHVPQYNADVISEDEVILK